MRILVTGWSRLHGSVVTEELLHAGHQVVVYDNLLEGHREAVAAEATLIQADLLDDETLRSFLWLRNQTLPKL